MSQPNIIHVLSDFGFRILKLMPKDDFRSSNLARVKQNRISCSVS